MFKRLLSLIVSLVLMIAFTIPGQVSGINITDDMESTLLYVNLNLNEKATLEPESQIAATEALLNIDKS